MAHSSLTRLKVQGHACKHDSCEAQISFRAALTMLMTEQHQGSQDIAGVNNGHT